MKEDLLSLVRGRRGHFAYESGHHGELWFDLETLCKEPAGLTLYISRLAAKVRSFSPEVVCSPLVEGAFIGLLVAAELGCSFSYAARFAPLESDESLFPVEYRLPKALHSSVKGKRVVIVNDLINAGSAVRGTFLDLQRLGAKVVAVTSLVVMGEGFVSFAAEHQLPLESLASLPNNLWKPDECPLCASGVPIERLATA
jgi:orotate phosphoribosyltransferase